MKHKVDVLHHFVLSTKTYKNKNIFDGVKSLFICTGNTEGCQTWEFFYKISWSKLEKTVARIIFSWRNTDLSQVYCILIYSTCSLLTFLLMVNHRMVSTGLKVTPILLYRKVTISLIFS